MSRHRARQYWCPKGRRQRDSVTVGIHASSTLGSWWRVVARIDNRRHISRSMAARSTSEPAAWWASTIAHINLGVARNARAIDAATLEVIRRRRETNRATFALTASAFA